VAASIVAAVAFAGACSSERTAITTKPPETMTAEDVGTLQAASDIVVDEAVTVRDVDLEHQGYVAIYDGSSGAPGDLLGVSSLLPAGPHEDVEVELDGPLGDRTEAFVIVHNEDNGNSSFDAPAADRAAGTDRGVLSVRISLVPAQGRHS